MDGVLMHGTFAVHAALVAEPVLSSFLTMA